MLIWFSVNFCCWVKGEGTSFNTLHVNVSTSYWSIYIEIIKKNHKKIPMFISTLFTVAGTWKQPRCPLTDEWIKKLCYIYTTEYSVQFSCSVFLDSLWPHGLQHSRLPCPSLTPATSLNSCLWSQCCHPTISYSVISFSSHLQSFPAWGSFQISQFFASGGQSVGVSASRKAFTSELLIMPKVLTV